MAGKGQGLALGKAGSQAGAEGGHKGVPGGGGVGHMVHLDALGVMDPAPARRDGAVLPQGDNEIFHPAGLERPGDQGHVLHIDAAGYIDGMSGQNGRLVLVGGQIGGAGQQPIGHGGGRGGIDHHRHTGVLRPLCHRFDDLHLKLKLHHHHIIVPDLLPEPGHILHRQGEVRARADGDAVLGPVVADLQGDMAHAGGLVPVH